MHCDRHTDSRRDRLMATVVDKGIALQAGASLPAAYHFFLRWQVPRPVLRRVMADPSARRTAPPA